MVCTFFGHRDCYELDEKVLRRAIEELIVSGVDTFYVGNQGHFDRMVLDSLLKFKKIYQHLSFSVVLAYMPTKKFDSDIYRFHSIYPEGLETGHPKFAVEKRNKWMVAQSNYCLCYVNQSYGGAYKFACLAKRKGLIVINLGNIKF